VLENSPFLWQKYVPLSRFLIDPVASSWRSNFIARKFTKFMAQNEHVSRFLINLIGSKC